MTEVAPWFVNLLTRAAPNPLPPPVTTATAPSKYLWPCFHQPLRMVSFLSVADPRVKAECQELQVRWESRLAFRRCLISEIKGNLDSPGLTFSQKTFQCHPIISQAEGLDRQEVESQPFLF